jgi:hypothetical protein
MKGLKIISKDMGSFKNIWREMIVWKLKVTGAWDLKILCKTSKYKIYLKGMYRSQNGILGGHEMT